MLKKLKSLFIVEEENANKDSKSDSASPSEETVAPISKGGSKSASASPTKSVSPSEINTNAFSTLSSRSK